MESSVTRRERGVLTPVYPCRKGKGGLGLPVEIPPKPLLPLKKIDLLLTVGG